MASLITHLTTKQQKELFENLNYMNMEEIKTFCRAHKIEYVIFAEYEKGKLKKTRDDDRKGIILAKIKYYLKTGVIQKPTIFIKNVVSLDDLPTKLTASNRVYYGQYKKDPRIFALMDKLTGGEFKSGAIARIVLRELWSSGKAPTYKQFAQHWLAAVEAHKAPNPEWAFLKDRHSGTADKDWKKLRIQKAKAAIAVLNKL